MDDDDPRRRFVPRILFSAFTISLRYRLLFSSNLPWNNEAVIPPLSFSLQPSLF